MYIVRVNIVSGVIQREVNYDSNMPSCITERSYMIDNWITVESRKSFDAALRSAIIKLSDWHMSMQSLGKVTF